MAATRAGCEVARAWASCDPHVQTFQKHFEGIHVDVHLHANLLGRIAHMQPQFAPRCTVAQEWFELTCSDRAPRKDINA